MRELAVALSIVVLAACGGGQSEKKDPGPPPGADHQEQVRAAMDQYVKEPRESWQAKYDGTPTLQFSAAPVPDRVARAAFEPETGQPHSFGYVHGWRVDFRFTPRFVGFPEQRESQAMGFFRNGRLLGVFSEQDRPDVPLDLAKWSPMVVTTAGALPLPTSRDEVFR